MSEPISAPAAVALVVAAGRGQRLGFGIPKALVQCAGRPLMAWSLALLDSLPTIAALVVALPDGGVPSGLLPERAIAVTGGAERSQSVRAALAAAPPGPEFVLVHDAARPLVSAALVDATLAACAVPGVDAAIAATAVTDTIKEVTADRITVARTLDRGRLRAVQTPQVFRRALLERVLSGEEATVVAATDDASLVEAAGGRVVLVDAPPTNIKVTTAADLKLAAALLSGVS